VVEVCFSAFILGSIFTTLPLSTYYASREFHSYFLNVLGDIHYYLPGVFEHNPNTMVNGQLWTVPWELKCYAVMTVLAILPVYKHKNLLIALIGLVYIFQVRHSILHPEAYHDCPDGTVLLSSFVCGLFLNRFRQDIPFRFSFFLTSLVCCMVLFDLPNGNRFSPMFVAYVTVYLGMMNPPRNRVLLSGDYSYGLFLYGFPIQQASVALGLTLGNWYYNFLFSYPCATLLAVTSWWLFERPMLGFRSRLKDIESRYLQRTVILSRVRAFGSLSMGH
jgi:peptidoglycan/LPS O-acetylase OafA/YrhL